MDKLETAKKHLKGLGRKQPLLNNVSWALPLGLHILTEVSKVTT